MLHFDLTLTGDRQTEQTLLAWRDRLEHTGAFWQEARQAVEHAFQRMFETHAGPAGEWRPLDPDTIRIKGDARILEATGRLKASLTGGETFIEQHDHATFTPEVPYLAYVSRRRPVVGVTPDMEHSVMERLGEYLQAAE